MSPRRMCRAPAARWRSPVRTQEHPRRTTMDSQARRMEVGPAATSSPDGASHGRAQFTVTPLGGESTIVTIVSWARLDYTRGVAKKGAGTASIEEIEANLQEMERKMDRLRGLYESFFLG